MKRTHQTKLIALVIMTTLLMTGCDQSQLSHYNVIWDSPSADYNGTMPIGNGDIGANVWVEDGGDLLFYISKTDAWSENARLLKLGKIRVRLTPNPFEAGCTFKQELNLKDGVIKITSTAKSSETSVDLKFWIDANNPAIRITGDATTEINVEVILEHWRTERKAVPTDFSFYGAVRGRESFIEADTIVDRKDDTILWYHRNKEDAHSVWEDTLKVQGLEGFIEQSSDPLLNLTFGALVQAEGLVSESPTTLKSPAATKAIDIAIFPLTAQTATAKEWIEKVENQAAKYKTKSRDSAWASHKKWWNQFWDRSWIFATSRKQSCEKISSIIPSNKHNFKFGMDVHGHNKLTGKLGRVSVFKRVLTKGEIEKLAGIRSKTTGLKRSDILFSGTPKLYSSMKDSVDWTDFPEMTFEAWVNPTVNAGSARILDKGTPGKNDGFLLDTHPGNSLRLIIGSRNLSVSDCLKANKWNHVAVIVDSKRDRIELYLDGKMIAELGQEELIDNAFAVTRGYVLQNWITACGGRGKMPIKFNGSIFTVDGAQQNKSISPCPDYRRWGPCYWWQNTRLPYWPMLAAGNYDMMQPLFKMYMDALPLAQYRMKEYYNFEGAYFPETMFFWGTYNNENYGWRPEKDRHPDLIKNHHVRYEWQGGIELTAMMLQYYHHTLDRDFLNTTVLPFAKAIVSFYDKRYERNAKGKLVIYPANALEDIWCCTNPTPEIAGLKFILPQLIELTPDNKQKEDYIRFLKEIPEPETDISPAGKKYILPARKGVKRRANGEKPECYAIFPYRLYGVGLPDLEIGKETFRLSPGTRTNGWVQNSIFAACVGNVDKAKDILVKRSKRFHTESRFPAFWGPNFDWIPDQDHGGVNMIALQHVLLQTEPYSEKIHLFPAWPKDWDCSFKLHTPGKTIVQAEVKDGKVVDLKVTPSSRKKDIINYLNKAIK